MNRLLYLHAEVLILRIRRGFYSATLALKMLCMGIWAIPLALRLGFREGGLSAGVKNAGHILRLCASSAWDTFMNRPLQMVNAIRLADLHGKQPPH